MSKAIKRIKKRKKRNRYDKFSKAFYQKVQNYFIRIAKTKKKYVILDNTKDTDETEKIIQERVKGAHGAKS